MLFVTACSCILDLQIELSIHKEVFLNAAKHGFCLLDADGVHGAMCLAMRIYAKAGDRTKLTRVYSELEQHLQDELNTKPLAQTTTLYRELQKSSSHP